jgi:hypothetical protein
MGKKPQPTPVAGDPTAFAQVISDHWKDFVMIIEAIVILVLALRLLGVW